MSRGTGRLARRRAAGLLILAAATLCSAPRMAHADFGVPLREVAQRMLLAAIVGGLDLAIVGEHCEPGRAAWTCRYAIGERRNVVMIVTAPGAAHDATAITFALAVGETTVEPLVLAVGIVNGLFNDAGGGAAHAALAAIVAEAGRGGRGRRQVGDLVFEAVRLTDAAMMVQVTRP